MPEVLQDTVNVKAGMESLGIELFREIHDASFRDFKNLLKDLRRAVEDSEIPTLIFFYYAGHGKCDNFTFAVLNEEKDYPLEAQLRALASDVHLETFVIGLFDCCREKILVP